MKDQAGSPPLVCKLDALAPEQRRKHQELSAQLLRSAGAVRELENGLAFQFSNEKSVLLLITEFIADEQLCCPFLDFDVHIEPQKAQLQLRLTGPRDTRQFLQAEFADILQS
jgi:hypothetical protein